MPVIDLAVQFVVVPGVLVGILVLTAFIPGQLERRERRLPARTGYLLGLSVFIGYAAVLSSLAQRGAFGLNLRIAQPGPVPMSVTTGLLLFAGVAGGVLLPPAFAVASKVGGTGLLTALLGLAAPAGLMTHLLVEQSRHYIVPWTLGALAGVLLSVTLRPTLLRRLV